jgi:hypothetical protein
MKNTSDDQLALDMAASSHRAWKVRLQESMSKGERLDVATISRDDCCELGTWLHSDGIVRLGHSPEFVMLIERHREFHLVTSVVALVINGKDYQKAQLLLQESSAFQASTIAVIDAITNLKVAISSTSE